MITQEYHIKNMKYYLMKMSESIDYVLWPTLMFFAPVKGILITVAAFIILDTISGIWKSRVTKTKITSKGLSGIVSKMLLYQAAIIATYLLDFYILGDILESVFGIPGLIVKAAALLLVFIEAQSINENYKIAKGVDMWGEFKKMLTRTKEVIGVVKDVKEITDTREKIEGLEDVFEDFHGEDE